MNHSVYLITGPSGSGKTALSDYFVAAGYACLEADSTPGLCYFVNKNNKPVPYPQGADAAWWDTHNYVWEIDRLRKQLELLDRTATGPIFLCGSAGNVEKAWELFTEVFYLDISDATMRSRIASSGHNHSFGGRVEEPEQLIRWAAPFKTEVTALGATIIDAERPLKDIATDILNRIKTKQAV